MTEELKKLLKVKSIVTLLLSVVVAVLALTDRIDIEQVYLMIIAFYFGTQHERNDNNDFLRTQ